MPVSVTPVVNLEPCVFEFKFLIVGGQLIRTDPAVTEDCRDVQPSHCWHWGQNQGSGGNGNHLFFQQQSIRSEGAVGNRSIYDHHRAGDPQKKTAGARGDASAVLRSQKTIHRDGFILAPVIRCIQWILHIFWITDTYQTEEKSTVGLATQSPQLKSHAFLKDKKRPQERRLLDCGSREEE